jgi:hypothetical protein
MLLISSGHIWTFMAVKTLYVQLLLSFHKENYPSLHTGLVTWEIHTKSSVKSSIIYDIMPCSLLKINQCFRETLVDFQWTAKCYIPEDTTLHNPGCENFKPYKIEFVSGKDRNGTI